MRSIHILGGLTALSSLSSCQVLSWCRDDKCADCISGITSAGSGYPTCAIYDTETVFGGQGFQPGVGGKFLYKVHGNFPDPCEGYPGNIMIRSPASLTDLGCGNLIFQTKNAQCSTGLDLRDTFMVQFCCGADHCEAAGVPWGRQALGGPTARAAAAAGTQGVMLMFPNGTVIPPIAVGYPPHTRRVSARQCKGYQTNSYVSNGEPYLKTFDTQIVSGSVPARTNATVIVVTYQQSYAVSTGFDIGIGDPFGIISAKVSFTFTNTNTKIEQFNVPVPVGDVGQMGFTPVYKCTKGTLKLCDGSVTPEQESCTPWVVDGVQQGDYEMILT